MSSDKADQLRALLAERPQTAAVIEDVLQAWPEHANYLLRSFQQRSPEMMAATEAASAAARKLMGSEAPRFAADYRWTCDRLRDEELFFHREGRYRLSTFAEADAEVYSDHAYMGRYVNGLLLSQVLWFNHVGTLEMFLNRVLPNNGAPFDYLEIGPGHGLMTYFAAGSPLARSLEAWDVSPVSLRETQAALETLSVEKPVSFTQTDILRAEPPQPRYGLIVISEVLEHLEQPGTALRFLRGALADGGRIFINVPINSPSPDHIYLLSSPDDVREMVEKAGLRVESMELFATQGRSIDWALANKVSVSVGVVAESRLTGGRGVSSDEIIDLPGALGAETRALANAVLAAWPEHAKFLRASFAERSDDLLETTEIIARLLSLTAADAGRPLSAFADDYRYLCEQIVYPEEIFFAREGRYRLSTFAEADAEVYANAPLMARYMNGLLVSDALWLNHASAMNDFARAFLPGTKPGGRHLEVGPGHGMLLHLAMRFGDFSSLSAWDVSPTSIAHTEHVLRVLDAPQPVDLQLMDLYAPGLTETHAGKFDAIVFSEILEHLEEPQAALAILHELLAPGGSLWINVPANGPAPDHLFLLRSPEEAAEVVAAAGFTVTRTAAFPVAGSSLERAIRQGRPISCVVVGTKAG